MVKKNCLIWFGLLLIVPLLLWYLPASFFDHTGITICLSKLLFNIECMGCGMTRAVMHFHHFQFEKAYHFNRGVVVVYPALVAIWGLLLKNSIQIPSKQMLS